jgi:hypothetical protein
MIANSQKTNTDYVCWVGHLGLLAFIRILLLRIIYPFHQIRYVTVGPSIARLNKTFLNSIFKLENVSLINNVTPHEEMQVATNIYDEAASFIENVIKPSEDIGSLLRFVTDRYNKSVIEFFIKQEMSLELEAPLRILNGIKLHAQKNSDEDHTKNIVVIKDIYWISFFKKHFKDTARIYSYPNPKEFFNKVYAFFKLMIEIILNGMLILLGKGIGKKSSIPKIAVLHVQGANFEKRTDFFWFPGSGLKPEQVLVYFKYSAKPPTSEAVSFVEKNHIPWVNLLPIKIGHKKLTGGSAEFNRFPTLFYLKSLCQTLYSSFVMTLVCIFKFRRECWAYWKSLTALVSTTNFFEAFFKAYHVKGHFAMHEGGRDMVAADLAIQAVGGVDFCTHWSSYDVVTMGMGKTHDVCFSWGPFFTKNFFSKPYYSIKNYVYSGYIFDGFFKNCEIRAKDHRQKLLKEGAEFIICVFDQNNPSDRPLWNREVEQLYRRLLNLVISEPKIGLIIKPKKLSPKLKIPSIASLYEKAEATKRCLTLKGDVFPNEAAQASDLTIGVAACSTASLEAALAGVRSITFDLESCHEHAFYQGGLHKTVFDDLDEMFDQIQNFRRDPHSVPEFGDYSFILPQIDPYQDRKASERIGQYMFRVMEAMAQGKDKKEAIALANHFYGAKYGADKVLEKHAI